MRRITVSCPGCGEEFARVPLDEAETVLFHGCPACRRTNRVGVRRRLRPRSGGENGGNGDNGGQAAEAADAGQAGGPGGSPSTGND